MYPTKFPLEDRKSVSGKLHKFNNPEAGFASITRTFYACSVEKYSAATTSNASKAEVSKERKEEEEEMSIWRLRAPGPDAISRPDIIIPGESPHLAVILVITCC